MPRLLAYKDSVYSWSAKAGLAVKGVEYVCEEINPFEPEGLGDLLAHHPFGRVPVFEHEGFSVYETLAILSYIDRVYDGPNLMPDKAEAAARAFQVAEIAGAYVYWPLVRQVFSHAVYRPLTGETGDSGLIEAGLDASRRVLAALEAVAQEGLVLNARSITVADLMLAPMLMYFKACPAASERLGACAGLTGWLDWAEVQPAFVATRPDFLLTTGETS
ncbi:glutathione S-transferase family protein [Lentibacter sp. XHP0401]|uniref:glutathione S-transferase family protein n=1 Tax=Lentibacter sp. XHP0401 TaxID=2984334 RepID=UPI0021E7F07B|nr:glutathione S-transferase family protein [Lentibacter sp. XHP0401]MCV2893954.1 glutathione S-transferase family protein [Lentibacter sp. XHP0401]